MDKIRKFMEVHDVRTLMKYATVVLVIIFGIGGYLIYDELDSRLPWTEVVYAAEPVSYDDKDNLQFDLSLTEDNEYLGGGYGLQDKEEPRAKRVPNARENELMYFTDKIGELHRFPERDEVELKYFDYDQLKDMYYSAVNDKGEKIPDKIIDLKAKQA